MKGRCIIMEENKTVEMVEKVSFKDKAKAFYVKHKTKIWVGLSVAATATVSKIVCDLNSKDEEIYVYESLEAPVEDYENEVVETETESEEEA